MRKLLLRLQHTRYRSHDDPAKAVKTEWLRKENQGARIMKHALALAHDVQLRLLQDPLLQIENLKCVGLCRWAKVMGGDFYDQLPLKDGSFAFTVGDVSGKGSSATVMMASIQMMLRNSLQQSMLSPFPLFESCAVYQFYP